MDGFFVPHTFPPRCLAADLHTAAGLLAFCPHCNAFLFVYRGFGDIYPHRTHTACRSPGLFSGHARENWTTRYTGCWIVWTVLLVIYHGLSWLFLLPRLLRTGSSNGALLPAATV